MIELSKMPAKRTDGIANDAVNNMTSCGLDLQTRAAYGSSQNPDTKINVEIMTLTASSDPNIILFRGESKPTAIQPIIG